MCRIFMVSMHLMFGKNTTLFHCSVWFVSYIALKKFLAFVAFLCNLNLKTKRESTQLSHIFYRLFSFQYFISFLPQTMRHENSHVSMSYQRHGDTLTPHIWNRYCMSTSRTKMSPFIIIIDLECCRCVQMFTIKVKLNYLWWCHCCYWYIFCCTPKQFCLLLLDYMLHIADRSRNTS